MNFRQFIVKLSGVWKIFLSLHDSGVEKCRNQLFEENKRFECSFHRIQILVIANVPSRLEKRQTLDILLLTDFFYEFLKIDYFPNFPKFSEIISCTY